MYVGMLAKKIRFVVMQVLVLFLPVSSHPILHPSMRRVLLEKLTPILYMPRL